MTDDWKPKTRKVKLEDVGTATTALLNHASIGGDRVLVEQDGATVAVVISASDYNLLLAMDKRREELFKALDAGQAAFADVPPEEVEREIQKALKKIRREATQPTRRKAKASA